MNRILRVLRDDSGFILSGGWAVAFLVFMFIMAVIGQVSWEGFGVLLLVSAVLTGFGALFSGPTHTTFVPTEGTTSPLANETVPLRQVPVANSDSAAADVECLGCATIWVLDENEADQPSFTCPDCGRLMDSGRFIKRSPVVSDNPSSAVAEVECIDCGAEWVLDAAEAARPSFTCPDCGRLMDADRFTKPDA